MSSSTTTTATRPGESAGAKSRLVDEAGESDKETRAERIESEEDELGKRKVEGAMRVVLLLLLLLLRNVRRHAEPGRAGSGRKGPTELVRIALYPLESAS